MAHIVMKTDRGRRLMPMPVEECEAMVERGEAVPIRKTMLYIDRQLAHPKAQAPEDLDSVVDEEPLTYETRELKAEPPAPRRRRGRPRKPAASS